MKLTKSVFGLHLDESPIQIYIACGTKSHLKGWHSQIKWECLQFEADFVGLDPMGRHPLFNHCSSHLKPLYCLI